MKYPRASRALRQSPDPTLKRARFTHMTLLCTISNLGLSQSGVPPDQILDLPLMMSSYKACVDSLEAALRMTVEEIVNSYQKLPFLPGSLFLFLSNSSSICLMVSIFLKKALFFFLFTTVWNP